jgi:hypothetical protein
MRLVVTICAIRFVLRRMTRRTGWTNAGPDATAIGQMGFIEHIPKCAGD